jgi:hypothetical protein
MVAIWYLFPTELCSNYQAWNTAESTMPDEWTIHEPEDLKIVSSPYSFLHQILRLTLWNL